MQNKLFVKTNTRNAKIDIVKVFLMFLVILVHYGPSYITCMGRIAVPLFFAIDGYYSFHKQKISNIKILKKILMTLIFYLVAVAVSILLKIYLNRNNLPPLWNQFAQSLSNPWNWYNLFLYNLPIIGYPSFWFLLALLYVYIVYLIFNALNITKVFKFILPIVLLGGVLLQFIARFTTVLSLNWWYIDNWVMIGLPFFTLGYTMHEFNKKLSGFRNYQLMFYSIFFFALQFVENNIYIGIKPWGFNFQYLLSGICFTFFMMLWMSKWKINYPQANNAYYWLFIPTFSFLLYVGHAVCGESLSWTVVTPQTWKGAIVIFLVDFTCSLVLSAMYISIKRAILTLTDKQIRKQPKVKF